MSLFIYCPFNSPHTRRLYYFVTITPLSLSLCPLTSPADLSRADAMNQPNFYGADFGFDSSNSSSTLTLKFDECEAITESSTLNGSGPETIDVFNLSSGSGAELGLEPHNSSNNSSGHSSSGGGHSGHSNSSSMMDALRDNPVLTTASMPIPTPRSNNNSGGGGGAITQNNNNNTSNLCRMNDTDFGLDFDLSQDLNMPQILLMDGADLNDDSSPSLFGLGHSNQYLDSNSSSGNLATEQQMQQPQSSSSSSSQQQQQQNAAATGTSSRPIDVGGGNTIRGDFANQSQSHTHHNQSHHHLLATAAAGHQMWGSDGSTGHQHGTMFIPKTEPLNLDDDAIYQVDKADLIQGE